MYNKKRLLLSAAMMFLLSGCGVFSDGDSDTEQTESTPGATNVVSQNQLDGNYYRPALDEEGRYLTSKNRGITLNLNSGINIGLFEKDLMRLSQEHFPTDEYFLQEGQLIEEGVVSRWIGRQTENNPEGLNPPEASGDEERVPRYLNSILELDFFKATNRGLELEGVSIGLALNKVDYYQAEQFGPWLEQEIPDDVILREGQRIADMLIRRLREIEGLEELPIMVGLYQQAPQDDLAGGVYIAEGLSQNGSNKVDNWDTLNERRIVFPLQGADSAEGNAFANFQSEVEAFFPNISGITGRAHYINDRLESLTVDIMTQFYGEAEMVSYTQYLSQSALTYLPADLDVEIIVESPDGVEAFLQKSRTETEYFSHVFD